jgi:hypothetical protein
VQLELLRDYAWGEDILQSIEEIRGKLNELVFKEGSL